MDGRRRCDWLGCDRLGCDWNLGGWNVGEWNHGVGVISQGATGNTLS